MGIIEIMASGFNPRSRMGSDELIKASFTCLLGFNPRSRMGSDLRDFVISNVQVFVSIHAPAWGATRDRIVAVKDYQFQSTLPHGERHGCWWAIQFSICFNPRSRMGSDAPLTHCYYSTKVSIHAPAWGAT